MAEASIPLEVPGVLERFRRVRVSGPAQCGQVFMEEERSGPAMTTGSENHRRC